MAFIANSLPSLRHRNARSRTCISSPLMKIDGNSIVSRRAALQLAGGVAGFALLREVSAQIDLKELKKEAEDISYEEEVTEVGPDAAAENIITQTKKKEEEPEFRERERELREEEETKYDQMVAEELKEAKAVRESFAKRK